MASVACVVQPAMDAAVMIALVPVPSVAVVVNANRHRSMVTEPVVTNDCSTSSTAAAEVPHVAVTSTFESVMFELVNGPRFEVITAQAV
jgi:hypothetical protein